MRGLLRFGAGASLAPIVIMLGCASGGGDRTFDGGPRDGGGIRTDGAIVPTDSGGVLGVDGGGRDAGSSGACTGACDDMVDCTRDDCVEPAGTCNHVPDDTRCTGGRTCDPLMGCVTPAACTVDGDCDDGQFCNGTETCDMATGCRSGTAPSCSDGLTCTSDGCDPAMGAGACVHMAMDTVCSDARTCTGTERCMPGAMGADPATGCVPGTAVSCDDGMACTSDVCVEPAGTCMNVGGDVDGDGFRALGCMGGNDCNDTSAAVYPGASEVCDGLDNDCSTVVDDGPGMTCSLGSGAIGCSTMCGTPGTQSCDAMCRRSACNAAVETCNGCDDNGNGVADDGFICRQGASMACTTMCGTAGMQACNATCTAFSTCVAATETCGNACDDNGNGMTDEGCGPTNDRCTGAIALSMAGMGTTVTGSTTGATNESACGSGGDVYYSFTLTQREVVYLDTQGSAYDTEVAFANACTGNLFCNDDSCFGLQSQMAQVLSPGTYYAIVSGFGGGSGAFTLRFQHLPTGNGTPVLLGRPASGAVVSGSTSGIGSVSTICGSASGPETMYYFTTCAYAGGSFSATTCSRASWDTQLYFRDATSGIEACNDDACSLQSTLTGVVSAGGGLRALYIDGYSGSSGAYSIQYTMP